MNESFWKNKKILITGHTGFKGSWLTIWLKKLGADITGFSKSVPTNPSLFETANIEKDIKSVVGDIQNYELLKETISKCEPEIIFHMAAQSLVIKSYSNPIETFSTNVMGTVNLLYAVKETKKAKIVINITSDKCYENNESLEGYSEEDPMGGHDPYSSSKGCAELITKSFRKSFFSSDHENNIGLASVRAGNVIGGGDWAENRLIPDIIRAIKNKENVKIRNPNALRPWQHVLDPLNGYISLAEKLWDDQKKHSEGWNFGPEKNEVKPVSWIIEEFNELWKNKINWVVGNNELHEANNLILNCQKAKSRLGWNSKINTETALKMTIEWYTKYFDGKNMREVTEEQIIEFQKL
jgi:CDP-glucose 4,6-dehydratase